VSNLFSVEIKKFTNFNANGQSDIKFYRMLKLKNIYIIHTCNDLNMFYFCRSGSLLNIFLLNIWVEEKKYCCNIDFVIFILFPPISS